MLLFLKITIFFVWGADNIQYILTFSENDSHVNLSVMCVNEKKMITFVILDTSRLHNAVESFYKKRVTQNGILGFRKGTV